MPPCGLLTQKYLESGDGTPDEDEDASHERNCFRIRMPKLQLDSVLESTCVSGCTFTVCRLISSVCVCVCVCFFLLFFGLGGIPPFLFVWGGGGGGGNRFSGVG